MAWRGSFSTMRTAVALESPSGAMAMVERNYCMRHARKPSRPAALTQWNRPSLNPRLTPGDSFLAGEPGTQSPPVEVATAQDGHDRPLDGGIGQQRGDRGGPGRLDDQLGPQPHHPDRFDERLVADGTHLVDVAPDERQVEGTGVGRRQPIRDRVQPRWS